MAVGMVAGRGSRVARKSPRNDEQVKVGVDVVRQARIVCAYRDKGLAEYLTEILAPVVARDLADEQAKAAKQKPAGRWSKGGT